MGNIDELLLSILLTIIGILIGLWAVTVPAQSRLFKNILLIFSYGVIALLFFWIGYRFNQQQLRFHVDNKLSQPINVYANGDFQGIVAPEKIGTFSRLSLQDFPLTVSWTVKKHYSFGDDMGETIKKVDIAQTIIIDNQVGENTYFHPVISSAIDQDCRISINDGTENEASAGIIRANFKNITPGYFILRKDSNVTLYCNDEPMWYGVRNGKNAGWYSGGVGPGNGNLLLVFFNP